MGITHCGVSAEQTFLFTNPFRKGFGALVKEDFSGGRGCRWDTRAVWDTRLGEGFSRAPIFGSWVAIDGEVGEIVEELGCSVAFWDETEEAWLGVDKFGVCVTGPESRIFNDVFEEGDICFYASNTEFTKGTVHSLTGGFEVTAGGGEFHEHRVVVWGDNSSGVAVSRVETDAKSGSGAIVCNSAVVGGKSFFRVFRRDTALDGKAITGDFCLARDSNFGFVKFIALSHEYL